MNHPKEVLTFELAGHYFALPVDQVQEVLLHQQVMEVPLAPDYVKGLFGLRGQVVTALNLRNVMSIMDEAPDTMQNILVQEHGELFSFQVDQVGEVLELEEEQYDPVPANLDERFREFASGLLNLSKQLTILLDANKLLQPIKLV